ncbi:MAG: hypothetical protein U5K00_05320 [Melioribacteraceae bacterium]|nr:hypothetical protein [Melioribacteraceae bacterium]
MWISTDDFQTGLIVVDFKDGSFEHMVAKNGIPGYISRNRIHQIYQDQFNTIWMPIGRGGVTRSEYLRK